MSEWAFLLLMVFIVISAVLIGFLIVAWTVVSLAGGGRQRRRLMSQESETILAIHEGLTKMEQRIEALETLLVDAEQRERKP